MDQTSKKFIELKVENAALRAILVQTINQLGKNDPDFLKGVKDSLEETLNEEGHDPLYIAIIGSIKDALS